MNQKRKHLLETALNLFNQQGFHATGIDLVRAESGVSKTTMYKYFQSKEELIYAALEMRHDQFDEWIQVRVKELFAEHYADRREGMLIALFDALDEWINSADFFGCNFINATAEFSDPTHPIHQIACAHKASVKAFIAQHLPDMPVGVDREELAKELALLIEGAIVCAQTARLMDSAQRAKTMAMHILSAHGFALAA